MDLRKSFFLLAFTVFGFLAYAIERRPHDFRRDDCSICHMMNEAGKTAGLKLSSADMCRNCHKDIFSSGYMHPVDIYPEKNMPPADLPLSDIGLLTCNTCHDPHISQLTPSGAPSYFLRRRQPGKQFCSACHADLADDLSGHTAALKEAHFDSGYMATTAESELDVMSRNCITCHDGAYATSVTIRSGDRRHERSSFSHEGGRHPLGIDYEQARLRRGNGKHLQPRSRVDKRIRFFDGNIGCGTCHDPFSSARKDLVMPNTNSRLCLACHLLGNV